MSASELEAARLEWEGVARRAWQGERGMRLAAAESGTRAESTGLGGRARQPPWAVRSVRYRAGMCGGERDGAGKAQCEGQRGMASG